MTGVGQRGTGHKTQTGSLWNVGVTQVLGVALYRPHPPQLFVWLGIGLSEGFTLQAGKSRFVHPAAPPLFDGAWGSSLGNAVRDVPRRAASGRHLGTSRPRYPGSSSGRPQRPRRGHPETRWELATRFLLVPTPPLRRTHGRVGPGVHPPPLWLPSHQTAPGGARPSSLPSAPPRPCLLDVGIRPPPKPSHRANRASSGVMLGPDTLFRGSFAA